MTDLNSKIKTLQDLRNKNVQKRYIEHIRYPRFRNLEDNTRIDFDFPITFFVGKNGGGKSSTLQSLYGCPKGYSLGNFWFTTELDPIKEFENKRNCFIYGYKNKKATLEVIKQRIHRDKNPDYWETADPVKMYDMVGERAEPIDKSVVYIDFRSELSAFDKFMYFTQFSKTNKFSSKQDYLRYHSQKLKTAYETNTIVNLYGQNRTRKKTLLDKNQIDIINNILGKDYTKVEILEHRLFREWGTSIRLKSPSLHYSEAYAGSGETAIVKLIHKIYSADEESLILLDEPETSLHSGAQRRLMDFILDVSIKKKHQFVISTHSPFLIENMPDNSIKVFSTLKNTGKFIINSERNYKEAFHELEVENKEIVNILVEDWFAKLLLDNLLEKIGEDTKSLFDVKYLPGGASDINQRLTTIMEFSKNTFVLFDGDQKHIADHIDLKAIPLNEQDTLENLRKLIKTQTDCDIKFYLDGGNKDNTEQEIDLCKKYLNFYKDVVFYFPENIPEDIVWDEEYAENRLKSLCPEKNLKEIIKDAKDSKEMLYKLCLELYGSSSHMKTLSLEFIRKWLNKKNESFNNIKTIIDKLKKA